MAYYIFATALVFFVFIPLLGYPAGRSANRVVNKIYDGPDGVFRQFLITVTFGLVLSLWLLCGLVIYSLVFWTLRESIWIALEKTAADVIDAFTTPVFYTYWLITSTVGFVAAQLGRFVLPASETFRRGRELTGWKAAYKKAVKAAKNSKDVFYWGGCPIPIEDASKHFCVVGATGSGKTITIRILMQKIIKNLGNGSDSRALVYDAKTDMLPYLVGMGALPEKIITFNPFDTRCVAWDMAADITSPVSAQQLASILIPEDKYASQPFFNDAARHLLQGVIISFIKTAPGAWTFRDVILALKNRQQLKEIVGKTPEVKDYLQYFENQQTGNSIMATISSRVQRYEFISAAWSKATETISLKAWLESDSVLVLGNDEATRTALDAINRVIFQRVTELVLAQGESDLRRTWFFLDEVREAGRLEGLSRLLTKGRSKGACVVLGFQDIEGLRDVYGSQVANELVGQCAHKAILRLESPETADWASSLFGDKEVLEVMNSKGESKGRRETHKSTSSSEQISVRSVVMASELMDIPPTNPKNGLVGCYLTPSLGAFVAQFTGKQLTESLALPSTEVEAIIHRDEEDQYLISWSEEELTRLGISRGAVAVEKAKIGEEKGMKVDFSESDSNKRSLLDDVGKKLEEHLLKE